MQSEFALQLESKLQSFAVHADAVHSPEPTEQYKLEQSVPSEQAAPALQLDVAAQAGAAHVSPTHDAEAQSAPASHVVPTEHVPWQQRLLAMSHDPDWQSASRLHSDPSAPTVTPVTKSLQTKVAESQMYPVAQPVPSEQGSPVEPAVHIPPEGLLQCARTVPPGQGCAALQLVQAPVTQMPSQS